MRLFAALSLGLWAALSSVACETSRQAETDAGTKDDASDQWRHPVPLDDFCRAHLFAWCEKTVECGVYGEVASPLDDCHIYAAQLRESCEAELMPLVEAGHALYNAEEAALCIGRIGSTPCSEAMERPERRLLCFRNVFSGTLTEATECTDDVQCVGRLECDLSEGCPGKCATDVVRLPVGLSEGEPCGGEAGTCAFGTYCHSDEGPTGTCRAWRQRGQTCGPAAGRCHEYQVWCLREARAEEGRCEELPGPGEECGETQGKAPYCARSSCDTNIGGACRQPKEQGELCGTDLACRSWRCGDNLKCGTIEPPVDPCPSILTAPPE